MQDHPCVWSSPARTALPQVNQSVVSCCPSGIPRAWTSVREYFPGAGVSLPSQPGTSKRHLLALSFQAGPWLDDGRAEINGLIFCSSCHLTCQALCPCQSKYSRPFSSPQGGLTGGQMGLFPISGQDWSLPALEHSSHFNSAHSAHALWPGPTPRPRNRDIQWVGAGPRRRRVSGRGRQIKDSRMG